MHNIIASLYIIQQLSVSFSDSFEIRFDIDSGTTVFTDMKHRIKSL